MKYHLAIKESAREDVADAFLFYEHRQKDLGNKFLDKLEVLLKEIEKNPKIFAAKYKSFRHALLKPFPYLVIFEVEDKNVIIYRVIFAKRHPKKRYKT